MLHLARRITFCVNVADLFQLRRRQRDGKSMRGGREVAAMKGLRQLFVDLIPSVEASRPAPQRRQVVSRP
jgi:hypothetical protein